MYLWYLITGAIPVLIAYFVWVVIAEMNHPIPFLGLIIYVGAATLQVGGLFFVLPSNLQKAKQFREESKVYIKYFYWQICLAFQRDTFNQFQDSSSKISVHHCVYHTTSPRSQQKSTFKISKKMSGNDEKAHIWMSMSLNIYYALFITIRLAGAESFTVVTIIAIDFLFHLTYTYKIIRIHNKVAPDRNDQKEKKNDMQKAILNLVLVETIEDIVPLSYAFGFIMAFYGPNAMLIGNVRSGIWAYEAVDDIGRYLRVVISLFGVDLASVFMNTYCLYKFANINLIQGFLRLLRKYWTLLVVKLSFDLFLNFCYNDINLGMDMTTEFSWISDEGRMNFINSSTELTEEEKTSLLASSN